MLQKKKKVVVGLSGGVDSTITAHLLKQEGYEVIGAFMLLWADRMTAENDQKRIEGAKRAANFLDIEFKVLDFRDLFYREVVLPFIDAYKQGLTPNPCVLCNQKFKFNWLQKAADQTADAVATGHYVRLNTVETEAGPEIQLLRGIDPKKDQSYVLYHLSQEQLHHVLFPLGSYRKTEVREIATQIGFSTASLSDSQDICFISPDRGYRRLLEEHDALGKPGEFIDCQGQVLGQHRGIGNYTIGQRKHLGVAFGKRMVVKQIDAQKNRVVVSEEADIMQSTYRVKNVQFNTLSPPVFPLQCEVAGRYQARVVPATVEPGSDNIFTVTCHNLQRAVTPGQSAVFYQGDRVLGGGEII